MEKHAHMIAEVFECEAILSLKDWVKKTYICKQIKMIERIYDHGICQISFYIIQLLDFRDKGGIHWGYIGEKNIRIGKISINE